MKSNRETAMTYVYKDEGGYAERAMEPGGAVNMGISFERYAAWWRLMRRKGEPTFADLKAMPRADADAIYARFFLIPAHFDALPIGVDYSAVDPFINGGGLAILSRACGFNDDKETFDPQLLWAATHRDPTALINRIAEVRLARNALLRNYATPTKPGVKTTFGDVWDRRTNNVRKRSLAMLEK